MTALKIIGPTLLGRTHPLSSAEHQRALLASLPLKRSFQQAAGHARDAGHAGPSPLRRAPVEVLQINVGKRCNQTCRHCHVDAGPDRREVMPPEVVDACLSLLERSAIPTLDITGGAPELHPRFREMVSRARTAGRRVIDRCNLTITRLPNYADLPEFFAREGVEIVASLPWYASRQTDAQRGDGTFEESLSAIRRLNELGYGKDGSGLVLNLVTNPVGAFLPPSQRSLEKEWKRELLRRHGVTFNHLYTITNMPISRFLDFLRESGNLEAYMERLTASFNPASVAGLMCRTTLSVGWDGKLYDCDFNQMLEMAMPVTILDVDLDALTGRDIQVAAHCFGCTAGSGSSCGGATVAG